MNFKKTLSLLLMLSLLVFLLSGCAGDMTKLQMSVEPNTGRIKMLSKVIKTDGDSISVSAGRLPSGAELQVYLYNEVYPDEYLLVMKLNSTKKSADFSIGTPEYNYKIGAVLFGADKAVTIDIKYHER